MSLTHRQFLVREVSEKIADLLQDRERAITPEQYQTHTRWIQDELDRIPVPPDAWFIANQAEKPFRHELVNRLVELLRERELATSQEDYDAITAEVQEAYDGIKCPVPGTFAARAEARRPPWVRVIEKVLVAIWRGEFHFPYRFDKDGKFEVLFIRTRHILEHMRENDGLRAFLNTLPIASDRDLKRQLLAAGVLLTNANGTPRAFEKTVPGARRTPHMVGISLPELWRCGLDQLAADQMRAAKGQP